MLSSDTQSEKVKNKKTTTMTYRIDTDVMRKINDDAAHRKISINAQVNQIL